MIVPEPVQAVISIMVLIGHDQPLEVIGI